MRAPHRGISGAPGGVKRDKAKLTIKRDKAKLTIKKSGLLLELCSMSAQLTISSGFYVTLNL